MKFKSSTEARHFINSKKAELGVIDSKIQARSAEAKDEAITIEARGLIIKEVEGEVAKRNQINFELDLLLKNSKTPDIIYILIKRSLN